MGTTKINIKNEINNKYVPYNNIKTEIKNKLNKFHNIINIEIFKYNLHACNDVLLIKSNTDYYILKIYNKVLRKNQLGLEYIISKKLEKYNIQIPKPIKTIKNNYYFYIGKRKSILYKYIPGIDIKIDNNNIKLVANKLGLLQKELISMKKFIKYKTFKKNHINILKSSVKQFNFHNKEIKNILKKLLKIKYNKNKLIKTIVHGNLNKEHISINVKQINIFDYERFMFTYRIFEIVRTAYYLGYRNNDENFDIKKILLFLKEFSKNNKINKDEIELIPSLILLFLIKDYKTFLLSKESNLKTKEHLEIIFKFNLDSKKINKIFSYTLN